MARPVVGDRGQVVVLHCACPSTPSDKVGPPARAGMSRTRLRPPAMNTDVVADGVDCGEFAVVVAKHTVDHYPDALEVGTGCCRDRRSRRRALGCRLDARAPPRGSRWQAPPTRSKRCDRPPPRRPRVRRGRRGSHGRIPAPDFWTYGVEFERSHRQRIVRRHPRPVIGATRHHHRWLSIWDTASEVRRLLRDQIRWIRTGVGNWSARWRRSSTSAVRTVA